MLQMLFYVAIAVEAMTAALAAGRRKMDWFGVCLLACVTALGGGTMRDNFLGHYPLYWVGNPYILLLVCGAALFTIAIARVVDKLRWTFLVLDALGLVVLTIVGCNVAMEATFLGVASWPSDGSSSSSGPSSPGSQLAASLRRNSSATAADV